MGVRAMGLAGVLMVLVLAVGAVGCGGDNDGGGATVANGNGDANGAATNGSDSDSGSPSPEDGAGEPDGRDGAPEDRSESPEKAEFVEAANRACAREWGKLVPRITEYRRRAGAPVKEGTGAYTDMARATFLPTFEAEVEAVRELEAPPGEEQRVEALLDRHQAAIEAAAEQGVESFDEIQQALARTSRALARYGLNRCTASAF